MPALLFAGHNKFELNDEIRPKLARYVMDGGTIIGDACCGWADFAESFRREIELIFPGRPLRKLLPDDPLYASYYKLGNLTYKKGDGSTFTEAACLEGIDFGCRTGVIFSPRDLTCGWDGHEHPRGTRVVIDEARQVGANIVTYILGMFQLGRFLSTTKVYHEAAAPTRDDFVFAQLIHDGDWDPDPSGVYNLLKYARDNSTLEVKFKREQVSPKDPKAATYPLLYLTGHHDFAWSDGRRQGAEEVSRSRRTAPGRRLLRPVRVRRRVPPRNRQGAARQEAGKAAGRASAVHCHYDIKQVDYTPRVREDFGQFNTPELEGISIDGKLAVIYSKFDLGNGWEQFPHAYSYGYKDESALQIGTNVIVFAITH